MTDSGSPPFNPLTPRVLFVFLDGVGVGLPNADINPFLRASLPVLRGLLDNNIPFLDEGHGTGIRDEAASIPLDPLLGVQGRPQSGTGQTALLTGENAPALYGRHFGPWVPVPLRPLLVAQNVLSRARAIGLSPLFANAYPSQYLHRAWTKRPSGPALAAHAAGILTRHEDHLARGEAVSSEILNSTWRSRLGLMHLPEITPEQAGRNLAQIHLGADLTLFAHYSTDTSGHKRTMPDGVAALERVDALLGGLIPALPASTLLVVASDHGNIEDVTQGHTLNPVFSLFRGPGVRTLTEGISKITDIPALILRFLTETA